MKKVLTAVVLLLSTVFLAKAQTGNWSGKLDVRGTPLTIVFHLDGDEPTMDSPDQAALGIPVQIELMISISDKANATTAFFILSFICKYILRAFNLYKSPL